MKSKLLIRSLYVTVLVLCMLATAGIGLLLETKQFVFNQVEENTVAEIESGPFPVSVDPATKTMNQVDLLQSNGSESFAFESAQTGWKAKIAGLFSHKGWYQNLASPISRILVIGAGERKEEVTKNFGDILGWSTSERMTFQNAISDAEPLLADGKFYPGQYVAHRGATPEEVALMVQEKFNSDIGSRYTAEVEAKVPLKDALIVASLLEREASDFENMREVSGVIWNRIFSDMPLQLDATLQYVKGGRASEKKWWPVPKPADKYLKSPYNTYANKGLPPAPIANPSSAAVLAALNPIATECVFYFHDNKSRYHCSKTYEEHVRKLKAVFGQGK